MYPLLIETIGNPHVTADDRLIVEFPKKNDITYLYVIHYVQSRFVTHKKEK